MCVRQKCRNMIKSGKVRTANATVVRLITCPHKLIDISGGQPTMYQQLTMLLFVSGYIAVLDTAKPGLKEVILKHL